MSDHKEEEPLLGGGETPNETAPVQDKKAGRSTALLISFLLMVVIGLGNKIFQKLQTLPMYNYAYFLSIYVTFIYIPLSFAYIWPMIIWGKQISKEQRAIPLYKFFVMGLLDGIAGVMQSFSVNYIPNGALIILITQSAIPISMFISRILLKAKYEKFHYFGASIVIAGLIVVLVPVFMSKDQNSNGESTLKIAIWCVVLILSCVPMTLSSVYKEKALGEQDIDVVYLNGWVAVFQFLVSIPLAIPAAYASNLTISELPTNFWNGVKCYVGINSITEQYYDHGQLVVIHHCKEAPLFVNLYVAFNVLYNILIIMILKYGSANILWLAMTLMVPLGNAAFALRFVPGHKPMRVTDIVGLIVIMVGLIIYRFWGQIWTAIAARRNKKMKSAHGGINAHS